MAIHGHYHVALQGTAASRPATPGYDLIYYATDTGQLSIYDTVGAAWTNVGFAGLSDPVAIGDGGTGQTTQTAAFDALSPTTTKGDLIVDDGTDAVRRAVPANQKIIIADSSTGTGWRDDYHNDSYTMYAGTLFTWTLASSGDSFGGTNQFNYHKRNFTNFREARMIIRASNSALSAGSISTIVYDVTNSQAMTPDDFTFPNDAAYYTRTSAWGSLNSATYGGDAEFEVRSGSSGSAADILRVGTIILELR